MKGLLLYRAGHAFLKQPLSCIPIYKCGVDGRTGQIQKGIIVKTEAFGSDLIFVLQCGVEVRRIIGIERHLTAGLLKLAQWMGSGR